jgi:hypothetical protein
MRALNQGPVMAVIVVCGMAAPVRAQTDKIGRSPMGGRCRHSCRRSARRCLRRSSSKSFSRQPAAAYTSAHGDQGPGERPRHSTSSTFPLARTSCGPGFAGLALVAHPFDDNLNRGLVGNDTAEKIFKPGQSLERSRRFWEAHPWCMPSDV